MAWNLLPVRLLLCLFALFFAYYSGRAAAAKWDGVAPTGRLVRWGLRLALTLFGSFWIARDWIAFATLGLAVLAAGLGFYAQSRPSRHEDTSIHLSLRD